MSRSTFASIDRDALAHNLGCVRALAGDARVMAVVKADAYGHGLAHCLPALKDADLLAVATLDEARAIRTLAPGVPVLLLEGVMSPTELETVAELGLETVVHSLRQIEWLERSGAVAGPRVWLKLDSGMHRLGFPLDRAADVHARLRAVAGVEQVVLMTHFACADDAEHPRNRVQLEAFDTATAGLDGDRCLANSAALLNLPEIRRQWVRAGLLLYGASPLAGTDGAALGLKPVMTLKTQLMAIQSIRRGEPVGYGARFVADRDLRLGVAAIGYGDGYPRNMPDGAPVRVNDRIQPLAGRVSMDMITIDLTGQPEARPGDEVVLWGRGLPVERVAEAAGTIPYELFCRVTRRVPFRLDRSRADG